MTKDKIEVSMNVYDIPIVIEELEKASNEIKRLQQENQQLKHNRDKAIEFGNGLLLGEATFEERHIASRFLNILKGDSDE